MPGTKSLNKLKNELTHYSVYVTVTIALLLALAIFVILFILYRTFYLATMVGGALSGTFGIITLMTQEAQSRKKVARITVEIVPEVQLNGPELKTKEVHLSFLQKNEGVRVGNKVATFIRLYVKIDQGISLANFGSIEGLVDISDVNHCPFPMGDGRTMIKVFRSKQDLLGDYYPGINVPIGKIMVEGDFFENKRILTLEVDIYEEFTHLSRKVEVSWSEPSTDNFPKIRDISKKFELY